MIIWEGKVATAGDMHMLLKFWLGNLDINGCE
jgi:hypothetical protein